MAPPFAGGIASVVNDANRWNVRGRRDARQPQAPVVVLEIEEERWIESTGAVDGVASQQHEGSRDGGNAEHITRRLRIDEIAHLITVEPSAEQRTNEPRREPAQHQIENSRIALAQIVIAAIRSARHGRKGADF